jgi:hypothetical protein
MSRFFKRRNPSSQPTTTPPSQAPADTTNRPAVGHPECPPTATPRKRLFFVFFDSPEEEPAPAPAPPPSFGHIYQQALMDALQSLASEETKHTPPLSPTATEEVPPSSPEPSADPAPTPPLQCPAQATSTDVEPTTVQAKTPRPTISKKPTKKPSVPEQSLPTKGSGEGPTRRPTKGQGSAQRVRVRRKRLWSEDKGADTETS